MCVIFVVMRHFRSLISWFTKRDIWMTTSLNVMCAVKVTTRTLSCRGTRWSTQANGHSSVTFVAGHTHTRATWHCTRRNTNPTTGIGCSISVSSVGKHFCTTTLFGSTGSITWVRTSLSVTCVARHCQVESLWKLTAGFTRGRNLLFVMFVGRVLANQIIWRCTSVHIRVNGLTRVTCVENHLRSCPHWLYTNATTQGRGPTSVICVTRHLCQTLYWKHIRNATACKVFQTAYVNKIVFILLRLCQFVRSLFICLHCRRILCSLYVYVHLVYSFHERRELHIHTVLDQACELHMRHEETFSRYCWGHTVLLQCGRSGYKVLLLKHWCNLHILLNPYVTAINQVHCTFCWDWWCLNLSVHKDGLNGFHM